MSEHTKLVVRHLPPNLPEDIFWRTLDPWLQPVSLPDGTVIPPKCTATFKSYVCGKLRQNKSKVDIPSRAYIQFSTPDQVLEFHQGYTNQAFRDSHGNLTFPKVEFAPYQKVAGPPKKIDHRIGTIETDRDYQAFLETLAAPPSDANTEPSKIDASEEKVVQPQITPLIEHLRSLQKSAQEAAASAKQSRQAGASHSSGKSAPGGRSTFAVPPQIMKRVVPNHASNLSAGSSSQKLNGLSSTSRDKPSHSSISSSKDSKQSKHSSPLPASSSNPSTLPINNTSSNKSQPIKPSKSKKEERKEQRAGGEGPAPQTKQPIKNPADNKTQPKKILQAPLKSTNNDPAPPVVNQQKLSSTSKNKDPSQGLLPKGSSSGWKDEELEQQQQHSNEHQHQNSTRGKGYNNSQYEGSKRGRGGGGMGRGGRGGGKPTTNNKSIHSSSHSQQQPHETTSSSSTHKLSHEQPLESNKSETAAARRRLGMALAGITSTSKPDRSSSAASRKDSPSKS